MAMTSLVPGILFPTPGLVHMHTQVDITTTAHDLQQRFRRASLNGKPWPADSPVARVYDVKNTSSRLIILNNKLNQEQQKCHLRAHSAVESPRRSRSVQRNMPERHFRDHSALPRRHVKCTDSSSPRYKPPQTPRQSESQSPAYGERGEAGDRPKHTGAPLDEWHHYSCQTTKNPPFGYPSTPRQRRARTAPSVGSRKPDHMHHPDLTLGQQRYLSEIARVYDMTRMKQLKQAQYIQLIVREQERGFFDLHAYIKYVRYISGPRKRQFGVQDPNAEVNVRKKEQPLTSSVDDGRSKKDYQTIPLDSKGNAHALGTSQDKPPLPPAAQRETDTYPAREP